MPLHWLQPLNKHCCNYGCLLSILICFVGNIAESDIKLKDQFTILPNCSGFLDLKKNQLIMRIFDYILIHRVIQRGPIFRAAETELCSSYPLSPSALVSLSQQIMRDFQTRLVAIGILRLMQQKITCNAFMMEYTVASRGWRVAPINRSPLYWPVTECLWRHWERWERDKDARRQRAAARVYTDP